MKKKRKSDEVLEEPQEATRKAAKKSELPRRKKDRVEAIRELAGDQVHPDPKVVEEAAKVYRAGPRGGIIKERGFQVKKKSFKSLESDPLAPVVRSANPRDTGAERLRQQKAIDTGWGL